MMESHNLNQKRNIIISEKYCNAECPECEISYDVCFDKQHLFTEYQMPVFCPFCGKEVVRVEDVTEMYQDPMYMDDPGNDGRQ